MTNEMANDALELKKLLQVGPLEFKGCSGLFAHKLGLILDFVASGAAAEPAEEPEDETPAYGIEFALSIAKLWRAGKMIGGDEDAVRDALLAEVEKLRAERTGDELGPE